jgi:hypothetical protein
MVKSEPQGMLDIAFPKSLTDLLTRWSYMTKLYAPLKKGIFTIDIINRIGRRVTSWSVFHCPKKGCGRQTSSARVKDKFAAIRHILLHHSTWRVYWNPPSPKDVDAIDDAAYAALQSFIRSDIRKPLSHLIFCPINLTRK